MKLVQFNTNQGLNLTFLLKALIVAIVFAILSGCGGANDSELPNSGEDGATPVEDIPDPIATLPPQDKPDNRPPTDKTPTPDNPSITPTPETRGSADLGISIPTDTEHYSTDLIIPRLALGFGLLESSGGSYELEPGI